MRWNTEAITTLLTDPKWEIVNVGQGGDVDSDNLVLFVPSRDAYKGRIFVRGFSSEEEYTCPSPEDCEVEMVEVQDGEDSSGGLNSPEREVGFAYVEVRARLLEAGFIVVPCMDVYF